MPYDPSNLDHQQQYERFEIDYGLFFISSGIFGGKLLGECVLENALSLASTSSASAVEAGIRASLGAWSGGLSGGGDNS